MPVGLLHYEMLLPSFGLVLARVAGLVLSVPVLSHRQMPRVVRIWLAVTLALMTFPIVTPYLPTSLGLGQMAVGMVTEFIIGEVLGFAAAMTLMAAQIAGGLISQQSGLALSTVLNPMFEEESTVLDQLWFFAALMFFLALHGHVAVVNVLLGSFKSVPPLMARFDGTLADLMTALVHSMFESALRLAGPAILALLLTSLVLGFLTKTMPQLNVMTVGFGFKILIGMAAMALSISFSEEIVSDSMFNALGMVGNWFDHMSTMVMHGG